MRMILVGAGALTRELLSRLGQIWDISVVDASQERINATRSVRSFRETVGDGSSGVVLRKAGLEEAYALVAATDDDEVNLEACRLARAAGLSRIVGLANSPKRLVDYHAMRVRGVSAASLAARQIEVSLESRRITSKAFANAKAEAIEVRVAHDAPVCGRTLQEIHAENWIVGAVLRDGELIVPHGDTTLEPGDLVTVVGPAAEFAQIIKAFTAGEGRFPLQYGRRVALVVDQEADLAAALAEAEYLARNSLAAGLLLVHRDPDAASERATSERIHELLHRASATAEGVEIRMRAVRGSPARALARLPSEESVGVVVLPARSGRSLRARRAARQVQALVRERQVPVLLSRRTHPYGRILLPARLSSSGRQAARVAIDLARLTGSRLTALAAIDPLAPPVDDDENGAKQAIAWITEEAAAQAVEVTGSIRDGNPVQSFLEAAVGQDLVILSVGQPVSAFFRPNILSHLVRRLKTSLLLVPADD